MMETAQIKIKKVNQTLSKFFGKNCVMEDNTIRIFEKEYEFTRDSILVKEPNRIIALEGDSMIESMFGIILIDYTSRFGFVNIPFIPYDKLHFVQLESLQNFSLDTEKLYKDILIATGDPKLIARQLDLPKKFILAMRALNRKFARKQLFSEFRNL